MSVRTIDRTRVRTSPTLIAALQEPPTWSAARVLDEQGREVAVAAGGEWKPTTTGRERIRREAYGESTRAPYVSEDREDFADEWWRETVREIERQEGWR